MGAMALIMPGRRAWGGLVSNMHPQSYGAREKEFWDHIWSKSSYTLGSAIDGVLNPPDHALFGGEVHVKEIAVFVPISNEQADYYMLSADEYDVKYPPPSPLPMWLRARNWLNSSRYRLGVCVGSWIAGVRLEDYDERHH